MGEFAVDIAMSYRIGAARGDRSILSAMDIRDDELFAAFGQSINELILRHRKDLESKREKRGIELGIRTRWLEATSTSAGPKERWVDGTPEYSFYICGLRKLFPEALFIHIFRDVRSVVRSMLNFNRVAETQLVANEQEAYEYWLRTVKACLNAEQAYGPHVIHRLRYSALIEKPEQAIRSLLGFIGEPYSARCLEPLAERINSSNVPPDFKSEDPATDPAIVEKARRLSADIEKTAQPSEASPAAAEEMEVEFQQPCLKAERIKQELKHQIARQQQHYLTEVEAYKAQIARQEQYYSDRVRKQLQDTKKLASLLDNTAQAVARLRTSRRWKLVNLGSVIKARLSRGKVSTGYGHLDKIVAAYSQWRSSHPETAKLDRPNAATESSVSPGSSDAQFETVSEIRSIENVRGTSA
jgi:hypothetical protein